MTSPESKRLLSQVSANEVWDGVQMIGVKADDPLAQEVGAPQEEGRASLAADLRRLAAKEAYQNIRLTLIEAAEVIERDMTNEKY